VYQDNVFDLLGGGDVAEPLGLAEVTLYLKP